MSNKNPPNFKWSEDAVRKAAKKFTTLGAFRKAHAGAYTAALRYEIVGELFEKKRTKWTVEELIEEVKKYKSRVEVQRGSPGAYGRLIRHHPELLDASFGEYFKWKEDDLRKELLKYESKGELQKASGNLYSITLRRFPHLLDECYVSKIMCWDRESVIEAINLCESRRQFSREFPGARRAIDRDFPELDALLPDPKHDGTSNDTVYIWKALGQFYNGHPVYKIGITSERLNIKRIEQVSKESGFSYDLICCEQVVVSAAKLESKLLLLGEHPGYIGFNGSTEFRALSDSALYAAISIISENVRKNDDNP